MTWIEFADRHAVGLWFLAVFTLITAFAIVDRLATAIAMRRAGHS